MTPDEVAAATAEGAIVLDLRAPRPYAREHLPGALTMQFNRADLADRAELMLPRDVPLVVHAEPEPIARVAVELLAGAGFRVAGALDGGLAAWKASGLGPPEHGMWDAWFYTRTQAVYGDTAC